MSTGGKYVRAPEYVSDSDKVESREEWSSDETSCNEQEVQNSPNSTNHGTHNDDRWSPEEPAGTATNVRQDTCESTTAGKRTSQSIHDENREYIRKIEEMQSKLDQLAKDMSSYKPWSTTSSVPLDLVRHDDDSWNCRSDNLGPSPSTGSMRLENIQPFPNNVPANQMWEQWNRFIDRFQIAASLYNVNDPVKLTQTLYLSLGEKLQGITRAAYLRPSLRDPNCYSVFIKNIESYLQSMVDLTAEHDTFSNLKQGADEPTITFHARLMEKVRLCRYSSVDENRFVRMQLLKGLRNRDVARTARMLGYDSAFIVQSATREEAYTTETVPVESPQAFAVAKERPSTSNRLQGKRRNESSTSGWTGSKQQRQENESRQRGFGRRSRCPKCHQLFHKFGSCPAANRNCNTCGKRGHFSATCRKKQTNNIQVQRDSEPVWTDEENDKKVNED